MKNKIKRYILHFSAFFFVTAMIGRIAFLAQVQNNRTIQLTIFLPNIQECNDLRLMDGIRDCANDYSVLINTVYGRHWTQQDFQDRITEETQLGTEGILVIYPELFLTAQCTEINGNVEMKNAPLLAITDEMGDCFSYNANYVGGHTEAGYSFDAENIKKIVSGEITELFVPNEYQMGYRCIEALYHHARGMPMKDVKADDIVLTKEQSGDMSSAF